MKIEIEQKEIEAVLLEWAKKEFPGARINAIEWAGYRVPTSATLEWSDAVATDAGRSQA